MKSMWLDDQERNLVGKLYTFSLLVKLCEIVKAFDYLEFTAVNTFGTQNAFYCKSGDFPKQHTSQ